VCDEDGKVDEAATETLRAKMRAKRGPKKIFDRGFESIEELKGRCKAETGFDPPAQPRFTKWAAVAAEAMLRKKGIKAA
jgi:N-methylhydantoinase B